MVHHQTNAIFLKSLSKSMIDPGTEFKQYFPFFHLFLAVKHKI